MVSRGNQDILANGKPMTKPKRLRAGCMLFKVRSGTKKHPLLAQAPAHIIRTVNGMHIVIQELLKEAEH